MFSFIYHEKISLQVIYGEDDEDDDDDNYHWDGR